MRQAELIFDDRVAVGTIEETIFGSFIEHMGRSVYGGFYDPEHKTANDCGFREDVISAVRDLNISTVRYPGGNFVSGYDWKKGVGEKRVPCLELAWKEIESNRVGVDEFMEFAKQCGFETMMAVNLGTGSPQSAAELVEYCNGPAGGCWSNQRIANGHEQPYGIKRWCLGNEMDGDWQISSLPAQEYAQKALTAARMMRRIDPDLELIACGSSNNVIASYPAWDRIVLETLYDEVDYLSVHTYYYTSDEDTDHASYLGSYKDFEDILHTITAVCDYVKAVKRSSKTMKLSVDEWNVWRHYPMEDGKDLWTEAPERLECTYNLLDAIVFSSLLCVLLNHCDRVKMACLAQLINVIAPIRTIPGGAMFRQTIYYPFQAAAAHMKGKILRSEVHSPEIVCDKYGRYGSVAAAVALDEAVLTVLAVNLDLTEEVELCIGFRKKLKMIEWYELYDPDADAKNSFEQPQAVELKKKDTSEKMILKPHSFHLLIFDVIELDI